MKVRSCVVLRSWFLRSVTTAVDRDLWTQSRVHVEGRLVALLTNRALLERRLVAAGLERFGDGSLFRSEDGRSVTGVLLEVVGWRKVSETQ